MVQKDVMAIITPEAAAVVVADREDREVLVVLLMALMALVLVQAPVVQEDKAARQIILDMVPVAAEEVATVVEAAADRQTRFVETQVVLEVVVAMVPFVSFGLVTHVNSQVLV
jgi:hypothetical protein